jgi:hypothetical protein
MFLPAVTALTSMIGTVQLNFLFIVISVFYELLMVVAGGWAINDGCFPDAAKLRIFFDAAILNMICWGS